MVAASAAFFPSEPTSVTVAVPPGVPVGGTFFFSHLGFRFQAVVPPGADAVSAPGIRLLIRLPPEVWAQTWSSARAEATIKHPPKPKPPPLTSEEIIARHVSSLISKLERQQQAEEAQRRRLARHRMEEEREVSNVLYRLVRTLEQRAREEARLQREVRACVERLVLRVERQVERQEEPSAKAWSEADPEVASVMRQLIRNVEEACDADARQRKIEREVSAVVRRLVSRVEHTSTEFEALVGDPEYERQQLAKLDQYLTSIGGRPGLVFWPGWTIRLDVRQTGGTAGDTDLYFFDERRKKFRSRLEVARHFNLSTPNRRSRNGISAGAGGQSLLHPTTTISSATLITVTVPSGIVGGQHFLITGAAGTNGAALRVTAPPGSFAGQQLRVKVPRHLVSKAKVALPPQPLPPAPVLPPPSLPVQVPPPLSLDVPSPLDRQLLAPPPTCNALAQSDPWAADPQMASSSQLFCAPAAAPPRPLLASPTPAQTLTSQPLGLQNLSPLSLRPITSPPATFNEWPQSPPAPPPSLSLPGLKFPAAAFKGAVGPCESSMLTSAGAFSPAVSPDADADAGVSTLPEAKRARYAEPGATAGQCKAADAAASSSVVISSDAEHATANMASDESAPKASNDAVAPIATPFCDGRGSSPTELADHLRGGPRQGLPAPPTTTPAQAMSHLPGQLGLKKVGKRAAACRACDRCLREDCGDCAACVDKPKFGGPGRRKQTCVHRVCRNKQQSAAAWRAGASASMPRASPWRSVAPSARPIIVTAEAILKDGKPIEWKESAPECGDSERRNHAVDDKGHKGEDVDGMRADGMHVQRQEVNGQEDATVGVEVSTGAAAPVVSPDQIPTVSIPSIDFCADGEECSGGGPAAGGATDEVVNEGSGRARSQRRSASLASSAWNAVRESERAARREAADTSTLLFVQAPSRRAPADGHRRVTSNRPRQRTRRTAVGVDVAGTVWVGDGDDDEEEDGTGMMAAMPTIDQLEESEESELEVEVDVGELDQAPVEVLANDNHGSGCRVFHHTRGRPLPTPLLTQSGRQSGAVEEEEEAEEEEEEEVWELDGEQEEQDTASDRGDDMDAQRDAMWVPLELRCCLTLQRLTDPAKGEACEHPPRCNYDFLRAYVGRRVTQGAPKSCPIAGCEAPIQRTRGVVRDDVLRQKISALPAHVELVWLRGKEMRTQQPGVPTALNRRRNSARGSASHEQDHRRQSSNKKERPRTTRLMARRKRQREVVQAEPSSGGRRRRTGALADNPLVLE